MINKNQIHVDFLRWESTMTKIKFYSTWTKKLIENFSDYLYLVRHSKKQFHVSAPKIFWAIFKSLSTDRFQNFAAENQKIVCNLLVSVCNEVAGFPNSATWLVITYNYLKTDFRPLFLGFLAGSTNWTSANIFGSFLIHWMRMTYIYMSCMVPFSVRWHIYRSW